MGDDEKEPDQTVLKASTVDNVHTNKRQLEKLSESAKRRKHDEE